MNEKGVLKKTDSNEHKEQRVTEKVTIRRDTEWARKNKVYRKKEITTFKVKDNVENARENQNKWTKK